MSDGTLTLFLRNLLSSWASRVLILAATFAVTPVIVHGLGTTQYGLWAIGFALIGYFSLLDLGVNTGLIRMISAANARGEREKVSGYVATALAFYLALGSALLLVVWVMRDPLGTALGVPHRLLPTAGILFAGVTIFLIVGNLTGVFSALLNGLEAIHIVSIITLVTSLLNSAALFAVILLHGGIEALVGTSVVVQALGMIAMWVWAARLYSELNLRRSSVAWHYLREIATLSLTIQVSNMAGVVNFTVDKVLVSAMIGLASAGLYDLGSRLTIVVWTMCGLVAQAAFPTASRLAQESTDAVRTFYMRAERYLLLTIFGLSGVLFVVAPWLIELWLGPGYGKVVLVTRFLTVAAAGLSLSNVAKVTMWGLRRSREVLTFELWRLLMHVALSAVLIWRIGFVGGLIGASISMTIPSVWLVVVVHHVLQVDQRAWVRRACVPPVVATVLAGATTWLAVAGIVARIVTLETRSGALTALVIGGAVFGIVYVAALFRLGAFEADELAFVRRGQNFVRRGFHGAVPERAP